MNQIQLWQYMYQDNTWNVIHVLCHNTCFVLQVTSVYLALGHYISVFCFDTNSLSWTIFDIYPTSKILDYKLLFWVTKVRCFNFFGQALCGFLLCYVYTRCQKLEFVWGSAKENTKIKWSSSDGRQQRLMRNSLKGIQCWNNILVYFIIAKYYQS